MKLNRKKMVVSGMFTALAVVLSWYYIPIGSAKCFPIQHMINILSCIFLGPVYGVFIAFSASFLRNILGTGSLLAYPGSMAGAVFCGICYKYIQKPYGAYVGEVIGTGIFGGLLSYPVANYFMGKETALFFYVLPFLFSTVSGTVIAMILLEGLKKAGVFSGIRNLLDSGRNVG